MYVYVFDHHRTVQTGVIPVLSNHLCDTLDQGLPYESVQIVAGNWINMIIICTRDFLPLERSCNKSMNCTITFAYCTMTSTMSFQPIAESQLVNVYVIVDCVTKVLWRCYALQAWQGKVARLCQNGLFLSKVRLYIT